MSENRLDAEDAAAVVRRYAQAVSGLRDLLTELDTAVGDGDHGTNLDRGMRAAVEALDADHPDTPGAVFNLVGRRLVSTVGGASGALYGTAFLRMAKAVGDATSVDTAAWARALGEAAEGIATRGRCEADDKTMYDVWAAAVRAIDSGTGQRSMTDALAAGAAAATEAEERIRPLRARRGRASYLGERSVGHRDPGAVSSQAFFACLADEAAT